MAKAKMPTSSTSPAQPDQGNLLTEALIGVTDIHGGRTRLTLPQVLARLADTTASTIAFTGLQAHQAHAWHAFLVQLAAMVCHRAGMAEPSTESVWWGERLRELGGGEAAWTLVVGDLAQPGFMQPPVPEGCLDGFANHLATPGSLDLLVTAKNHDRKLETGDPSDLTSWIYALISAQTGQGYSGKFNYGVFRMNGGLGNRPGIGIIHGLDLGNAFRRDSAVLIDARTVVLERRCFRDDGLPLLWLAPWDGTQSLALSELDPWTIECCRRFRLTHLADTVETVMVATKVPRVAVSDEHTGNVGDPWTPIGKSSRNLGKSLTLPSAGFTYQRVVELLLATDWEAPPTQAIRTDDTGDLRWIGRALVRGQGKTEGWHEREVPIDPKMRSRFARPEDRDHLAATAKTMIELAGVMRLYILKPALRTLWEDAEGRIDSALQRLEQQVDAAFFPHLWEHPDSDDAWRTRLRDQGRAILDEDLAALGPNADRWKRISGATSRFDFLLGRKSHPKTGIFLPPPSPKATIA